MEKPSLVGKWKLVHAGSDFLPAVETLEGAPSVLRLLGRAESEFFKIEKKKFFDSEEICITYVARNVSINNTYQLGTLNVDGVIGTESLLGIVQNCNDDFTEFTIHRLGPGCGQYSNETYRLNQARDEIQVEVETNSGEGVHVKLIKYLSRFDNSRPGQEIVFLNARRTTGWNMYEFWPSVLLMDCKFLVVKAMKVRTANKRNRQDHKIVESLWTREAFHDSFRLKMGNMAKHAIEGEEIIVFLVQVSIAGITWYVPHRYTEFETLKNFVLQQQPFATEDFQDLEANFPGKAMGLTWRKAVLVSRVEGLGKTLEFIVNHARYFRQTTIDAICSFLAIPENLAGRFRPGDEQVYRQSLLKSTTPVKLKAPSAHDAETVRSLTSAAAAATGDASTAAAYRTSAADRLTPEDAEEKEGDVSAGMLSSPGFAHTSTSSTAGGATTTPSAVAAAGPVQQQSPGEALYALLGKKGKLIIKHGRKGAPKQRLLQCTTDGSMLFWGDKKSVKSVFVSEVESVRRGTDVDRDASLPEAFQQYQQQLREARAQMQAKGESNLSSSAVAAAVTDPPQELVFGTENLRRSCKSADMKLSFSLILPTRTLDIQCKTVEDYKSLLHAVVAVCKAEHGLLPKRPEK